MDAAQGSASSLSQDVYDMKNMCMSDRYAHNHRGGANIITTRTIRICQGLL